MTDPSPPPVPAPPPAPAPAPPANSAADDARLALRQFGLDAAQNEYAELWDSWKVVEAKAQPLAAIGGIFLAGLFSYVTTLPATAGRGERALLILVSAALVLAIVLSIASILVRKIESPYLGLEGLDEIDRLIAKTPDAADLPGRREALLRDTTKRWLQACERLEPLLASKVARLNWSLRLLLAAACMTVPLVWLSVAAAPTPLAPGPAPVSSGH